MINVIIVDDERQSRNLLRRMLIDFCEGVNIIGEAKNVQTSITLLKQKKPDVLLLDIEMSDGTGFDLLNKLVDINFKIIFITGYDQYAIKAIKYAALDYLLKPVNLGELQQAIHKVKKGLNNESRQLGLLYRHYEKKEETITQIVLPGRDSHIVAELHKIVRIEAQGSYVMIYLEDQKNHLVVKSLSYYEDLLPSKHFFRIHKSHLINIHKVARYDAGRSGKVVLKDGSVLDIAARRKSAFNTLMRKFKQP